ncbi:pickpocket protein 28-like [Culicoides brevitarsis]|uniref:pickpocket protein 28-like n=1 Tax=Culicoides brevitarsis TaxID=469753 RepID=UPI00307CB258
MAKWNQVRGRLKKNLSANFQEYCEKTTIHGVRYIGEGHLFKRIVWLVVCCFLFVISGKQIYEIVLKWKQSPLVISQDQKLSSIEDIDFPAVTICHQTLPNKTTLNFNMEYSIQNCRGIIGRFWPCFYQFRRILLEDGLCYTFNLHSRKRIFRSNVYYPLDYNVTSKYCDKRCYNPNNRTFNVKDRLDGLIFNLQYNDEYAHTICDPKPKIYIHNPHDLPWDDAIELKMGEFKRTKFLITPVVIKTDDSLKYALTPEERGCYFPDERYLRFFRRYSWKNCEFECLTNGTIKEWNCTAYWMPQSKKIKPCSLHNYVWGWVDSSKKYKCNCLPDCNSVKYHVKKTGVDNIKEVYDRKIYRSYLYEFSDEVMDVEVSFEDSNFLAMRRHLSYSFADFLSQIGGILGCFLGISIFSLIELVYFCTVQMFRQPKAPMSPEK